LHRERENREDGECIAEEISGHDVDVKLVKKALGELWEKRSSGKRLFAIAKGKDSAAIRAKIAG
jgi:hypothetical protein